jgi:hypothetical protein
MYSDLGWKSVEYPAVSDVPCEFAEKWQFFEITDQHFDGTITVYKAFASPQDISMTGHVEPPDATGEEKPVYRVAIEFSSNRIKDYAIKRINRKFAGPNQGDLTPILVRLSDVSRNDHLP